MKHRMSARARTFLEFILPAKIWRVRIKHLITLAKMNAAVEQQAVTGFVRFLFLNVSQYVETELKKKCGGGEGTEAGSNEPFLLVIFQGSNVMEA